MRNTTLDSRAELDISTTYTGIKQIRQVGESIIFSRYSTIVIRLKTMNANASYQNLSGLVPNAVNDVKVANDMVVSRCALVA